MSTEDIQQIVDIATKPNGQTQNKHILVVVIVCMIPTILFGIDIGKWEQWKVTVDARLNNLETGKQNKDIANDNTRAAYIRNIKVKQP